MYEIRQGDMREVLREYPDNTFHSIVTDPPYHLVQNSRNGSPQPGDMSTPYGRSGPSKARSGFIGKTWDGGDVSFHPETWAECLRVLRPGGHLLAFGGSRTYHRIAVAIEDAEFEIRDALMWLYGQGFPKSHNLKDDDGNPNGWGTALKPAHEPIVLARKPFKGAVANNVLEHGTGALNIDASRIGVGVGAAKGRWPANVLLDNEAARMLDEQTGTLTSGKVASGGASRFFYTAKASKKERNAGLPDEMVNKHPTVKPVRLMEYLVRLVTPPGGVVLDPFCGSGTTGVACGMLGVRFVGIDLGGEEEMSVAEARVSKAYQEYTQSPK